MRIFEFEKGGGKENKDGIILLSLMKLNYVTKHVKNSSFTKDITFFLMNSVH